jgi:hypothetical protein
MYFVFTYGNRRMKSVEIVLRVWEGKGQKMMEGVNLRNIVSSYVNITMYSLYNNHMPIEK